MSIFTKASGSWKILIPAAVIAALIVMLRLDGVVSAAPPADAGYKGVKNCKMCHSDKHEAWGKTGHSKAYELLVAVGKQDNKECLKCHTTGYGAKGGFVDEATTPELKAVQCESCHGPGEKHNGDPAMIVKAVAASKCGECHMDMNIH